jgi:hypothetical protein
MTLLLFCLCATDFAYAAGGWAKVKDSEGIKLYERSVPGTNLMEYMAVAKMDVRMEVIGEALRDVSQYPKWLSDCESARIEKKYDRNNYIMYIVENPFLIDRRDIVLKNETIYDYENGLARITFYNTDEAKIPLKKRHVRIDLMSGSFQIECLGRNKAKFIYQLKVDPSGNIPKKIAYAVMKYYPFNSIKNLKSIVADSKYSGIAKDSEDEKQINVRSFRETSVKKIFGDSMMKVVRNKSAMQALLDADKEGIKNIALSGSAYEIIHKTAMNMVDKYIDKIIADKKMAESLKNNRTLHAEVTALLHTYTEADDETVDSIVARYHQ